MSETLRRLLQSTERKLAATEKEIVDLEQRASARPELFGDHEPVLNSLRHYRDYLEGAAKKIHQRIVIAQKSRLIQRSFKKVLARKTVAAEVFYQKLFSLDPGLRALFKQDMREQRQALLAMLEMIVAGLNHFEEIVPAMRALGARHVSYGVRPESYQTFGEALLLTLEELLGDDFTQETREAWIETYNILSAAMIKLPTSSGGEPT